MPETVQHDSYRIALNLAMAELNQLSEQIEMLHVRKDMLHMATEGLKPLLAAAEMHSQPEQRPQETRSQNDQRPPSGPGAPGSHVTEFPMVQEQVNNEPRPVTRFQQVLSDITDPLQQRIQSALISPSFA